jgi:hypothetical protein
MTSENTEQLTEFRVEKITQGSIAGRNDMADDVKQTSFPAYQSDVKGQGRTFRVEFVRSNSSSANATNRMTLVAAFKIENVPVLVGDLLITDEPGDTTHNFLPTRPDLSQTKPTERRRSGARRKVLILGGKLILGFTGSIYAGSILFKDLHRRFSETSPSPDELNFALRLFNIQLSGSASVVGWLADPEPRCFIWTAGANSQLRWVTHAILGTGADHFSKVILSANSRSYSESLAPIELARFVAITKATSVLANELSAAGTLQNNYGYGLEVATWNGEIFEFQNSLTCIFFNALIGPGDRNQLQPVFVRMYKRFDRFSIVQSIYMQDTVGPDGSVGRQIFVDFVTSLHDDCNDIAFPKSAIDPHASIYCFGIAWKEIDSNKNGFLNLTTDESAVEIQGEGKKFNFQLRDSGMLISTIREFVSSAQRSKTQD